jgi:hypothetical protein
VDDEKGLYTVQTPGGPQTLVIINESGLYRLIATGRARQAKRSSWWMSTCCWPIAQTWAMREWLVSADYRCASSIDRWQDRAFEVNTLSSTEDANFNGLTTGGIASA